MHVCDRGKSVYVCLNEESIMTWCLFDFKCTSDCFCSQMLRSISGQTCSLTFDKWIDQESECAIDLLLVINQYFNMVSHHQYHYRNSSESAAERNLSSVCCHNIYIRHFSPLQSAVDIPHQTAIPNNPFYLAATNSKRHSSTIKCYSCTTSFKHHSDATFNCKSSQFYSCTIFHGSRLQHFFIHIGFKSFWCQGIRTPKYDNNF